MGDMQIKLNESTESPTPSDTEMLDWLQKNTKCYGADVGWICRNSFTGRGLRLHETTMEGAKTTVREAIIAAMEKGI